MKIKFGLKEWISLLIIPIMYSCMYLVFWLTKNSLTVNIIDTIVRLSLMCVLIYLFKETLKNQWVDFKCLKKRKWLIIFAGAILLQIVISVTSAYAPSVETKEIEMLKGLDFDLMSSSWSIYFIMLFTSLSPLATALIEDITFKYTLLRKLLNDSVIWNVILVILNSILFGAIHYGNFGNSVINTIPYMVAGLFLNIVYLKTKNLWYVLFIHLLNNFILGTFSLIFIGILRFII